MSALRLVTPPATEPVSLVEAKAHLRVTDDDYDTEINAFIRAARRHAERFLGRALIDQTWDYYLDTFPVLETSPEPDLIEIPMPPLIAVSGVFYQDSAGDEQEFTSFSVDTASQPGRIYLPSSGSWPSAVDTFNAVRIRFRAGYLNGDSPPVENVDPDIKAAIKLMIGSLYANRETEIVGTNVMKMPWSAEQLLRFHRIDLSMA